MKNENYDFLENLSTDNVEELTRIMEKYPLADKSMKNKIIDLCEENIVMKKNNNNLYEVNEPVEVIKKTAWYRNPALTIAASLTLVIGAIAGAGFAGMRNTNPDEQPPVSTQLSVANSSEPESTTASIRPLSTAKEVATTTAMDTVCIDDIQSCVAVGSITTSEYIEIVTPFIEAEAPTSTEMCSGVPLAPEVTTMPAVSESKAPGSAKTSASVTTTVNLESLAMEVLSTATTDESGIPPQIHLPNIEVSTPAYSNALVSEDSYYETAPVQSGLVSGKYTQTQASYAEPAVTSCTMTTPVE